MSHTDDSNSILEELEIAAQERQTRLNAGREFNSAEVFVLSVGLIAFGFAVALGFQIPYLASSFSVAFIALVCCVGVFTLRKGGFLKPIREPSSTREDDRPNSLKAWLYNRNRYAQDVVTKRGLELSRHPQASLVKARREIEFTVDTITNDSSTANALCGFLALFLLRGPILLSLSFPSHDTSKWLESYHTLDLSPLTALLIGLAFIRVAFHMRKSRLLQHKFAINYAIDLCQPGKGNA